MAAYLEPAGPDETSGRHLGDSGWCLTAQRRCQSTVNAWIKEPM